MLAVMVIMAIVFCTMLFCTGCWSFEKIDPKYDDYISHGTFISKWEAQIYAGHMRRKGYTVYLNKNNWFNNGGYFWDVYVKKSNEVQK